MKHNGTLPVNSIHEIARKSGVSVATVSRVLNNKENVKSTTRIKIQEVISRYNYRPRLTKVKIPSIGVVVQCGNELIGNYLAEVVNGIFDYCIEYNYNLQLISIYAKRTEGQSVLGILRENNIDGAIIVMSNDQSRYIANAEEEKFPYVVLNNIMPDMLTNYIDVDNNEGIKIAIRYLYDLGHRKICFLCGDTSTRDHIERLNAFKTYMKKYNIFNDKLVISFIKPGKNDMISFEEGYQQMKYVLDNLKDITAVIANNDDQAIGAIRAMGENSIAIPRDISIIGFDDYQVSSYANPPLTTIRQPLFDMGRLAAAKLMTLILGASEEHINIKMKPELVMRASTGPVKS